MRSVDEIIHATARLGVVTRPRLHAQGVTDHDIRGRLRRGSLRALHPGVYATYGTPLTYEARVYAACLAAGPGAVASHRSALVLWALLERTDVVEITAPRTAHPAPIDVVVHRPEQLRAIDVIERKLITTTNPLRTLLDAGAVLPRNEVAECVELALHQDLVTVRGLRMVMAALGGRGRSGTGALRWHLDRRALGDRQPESMIEPLMARLLYADLGIGPVLYQPTLVLDGTTVRPDFLVERALAVVEVDGLDAHSSRAALDHDLARQNLLVRHGYAVLRYTTTHLRRPARVAAEITEVCRCRIVELTAAA